MAKKPAATKPSAAKPSAAAQYALASQHTMLSIGSESFREEGARRVYLEAGEPVAWMELDGDQLVVAFAAPRAGIGEFADVMAHYTPVRGKPGWLRYTRPATRDPRPSLAARLGQIIGTATFERRAARKQG